jgi:hypothetical protein
VKDVTCCDTFMAATGPDDHESLSERMKVKKLDNASSDTCFINSHQDVLNLMHGHVNRSCFV